jgi:hypothetical protein
MSAHFLKAFATFVGKKSAIVQCDIAFLTYFGHLGWLDTLLRVAVPGVIARVTRLGNFLPIGLLLEAHYDFLKG